MNYYYFGNSLPSFFDTPPHFAFLLSSVVWEGEECLTMAISFLHTRLATMEVHKCHEIGSWAEQDAILFVKANSLSSILTLVEC